ncbi:WD40 repeat-like protein [Suillus weaverae]|nr:WD40 repeat-like protein [Suillus weaverae]
MTLNGHKPYIISPSDRAHHEYKHISCISYSSDGKQMISGSNDKTIRRWDLREGNEIEEAREVCEHRVEAVGVSKDGRWVATAVGGVLNVSEVETGFVRTFYLGITCIDISTDSTLLAGASTDSKVRIWSLDTGELVAGPLEFMDVYAGALLALRLSADSLKLA